MSGLLAELKRRNVFKVATIYVVVSWLILQVATVVFPVFEIPDWASRLVVLLLGLGFFIAVILAWAFDLTPEGIEKDSVSASATGGTHVWDWVLATLLLVVIGLMVKGQIDNWQDTPTVAVSGSDLSGLTVPDTLLDDISATALPAIAALAVLPFDNLSPDVEDEYIADGLADELLGVLGRVSEIRVASRTSTVYFKNRDVDNSTIAQTLMVDHVLSGSVRRAGNMIRVTAVLDRPQTGELLWTDSYDRSLDDILEIQSDIAQSVAAEIVPVMSPESTAKILAQPTSSSEAYDFFLRGRDYLRRPRSVSNLASATELFDRAINLDPRFAQAYAGRCEANLNSFERTRNTGYFENAEMSCHRALTIDNSLWEVHVALGNLYQTNGQLDEAILELQVAIKQQPNAVDPFINLATVYAELGRTEEAEATFLHAETLESGYWRVHNELGHFYYDETRYEQALARYRKVAALVPEASTGFNNLGNTYLAIGDLEKAKQAFDSAPNPTRFTFTNRGLVYYYQGAFAQAVQDQEQAIELAPDNHRSWGRIADAYRQMPGRMQDATASYLRAIELAQRENSISRSWGNDVRLGLYYAHTGQHDQAAEQLDDLFATTNSETAYFFAALVRFHLGEHEAALEYLQQAVDRGYSRSLILADPDLVALHGDRAFDQILGR